MTPEEAKRLLERTREQTWAFPSSFGDPGPPEDGMPGREEVVEATRVLLEDGDEEEARSHAAQAREHAESLDPAFGQAPLHMHAQALRLGGDLAGAAALFEESLALNRRVGDRRMVEVELHNLGHVAIRRGEVEAAERYFEELARDAGLTDPNRAALAYVRGDRQTASNILTRIDDAEELPLDDRAELEWLRNQVS